MKSCFLLALVLLSGTTGATTLHFPTEMALLVLDGKRVSPSMVRGAEQIELKNGVHQIVFKVEKTVHQEGKPATVHISLPIIAAFDTHSAKHVSIEVPVLNTLHDAQTFDRHPTIRLLDESGRSIAVTLDRLTMDKTTPASEIDYEQATRHYNTRQQKASQPQFSSLTTPRGQTQPNQWIPYLRTVSDKTVR